MHFKMSKYVIMLAWAVALIIAGLTLVNFQPYGGVTLIGWILTAVGVLLIINAVVYYFSIGELIKEISEKAEKIRKLQLLNQRVWYNPSLSGFLTRPNSVEYILNLSSPDGLQDHSFVISERSILSGSGPKHLIMPVERDEATRLLAALERLLRENADIEQRRAEQASRA